MPALARRLARTAALALAALAPAVASAQFSFQTATYLGILDGMGTVNGFPGINGQINRQSLLYNNQPLYFRIWVPDTRTVTFCIASVCNEQVAGAIFNASQQLVVARAASPWQYTDVTATLSAGTYYVWMNKAPVNPVGEGRFLLTAQSPVPDTARNSLFDGRALGTIGPSATNIREYVGQFDFDDYYHLTVPAGQRLNLQVLPDPGAADANLELYDVNGNMVARSILSGTAAESLTYQVGPQTNLRVRVYAVNRSYGSNLHTWHTLRAFTTSTTTPPPPPDMGGNTAAMATPWPSFAAPVNDRIGGSDPNDWYTFTVPFYNGASYLNERGVVTTITGLSVPATVALYRRIGSSNLVYLGSVNAVNGAATLPATLQIRDINGYMYQYYILVTSNSPVQSNYSLRIQPQGY